MKNKILLIVITQIIFSTILNAQKGIPDFNVTDIYGHKHILKSDYLDKGKYVFIDFFNTTCQSCNLLAPVVDTVFRDFGCNYGDVIFLAIERGHDYNETFQFTVDYTMTFPAISGNDGGGNDVHTDFNIPFTPYKLIISPGGEIVSNNPYQFSETAQKLRDTLQTFGLNMQECQGNNFMFFSLISSSDSVVGTIDEDHKIVNVVLPSKTDLTSLTANFRNAVNSTITVNNIEQISGETVNDFSSPLVYEITSETGVPKIWTVNVSTSSNIDFYNNKFKIYPNPSSGIFILENNYYTKKSSTKLKTNIVNLTGQIIKTLLINGNDNIIDLSELKNGIYFINIETKNAKIIKQLIKY